MAQRLSKVYEILKWKGKQVTVVSVTGFNMGVREISVPVPHTISDCNAFYVTLNGTESIPLNRVTISFDHTQNRLKLEWQ